MKHLAIVFLVACAGSEPAPQPVTNHATVAAAPAPAAAPAQHYGPKVSALMTTTKPSMIDRARANGACYGGANGVEHTGLTASELEDMRQELSLLNPNVGELSGDGTNPVTPPASDDAARKQFPPCAPTR